MAEPETTAGGPERAAGVQGATVGWARKHRFLIALGLIVAAGLGLRLWAVATNDAPVGVTDAVWYRMTADDLADGRWFVDPYLAEAGVTAPSAAHPPLFPLVLAVGPLVGADSPNTPRVISVLLGSGTVLLVGLLGRRLGGGRVGLIAATLAAVNPNFWTTEQKGMSESLVALLAAATLLVAYRAWREPSRAMAAWLGVVVAALTLTRAEYVLLFVLLVPFVLWRAEVLVAERVRRVAIAFGVGALLMAPWVGANLVRFDEPEVFTDTAGVTLASANCDEAYRGPSAGFWHLPCALEELRRNPVPPPADGSTVDVALRKPAFAYARAHLGELPRVAVVRVGRVYGLYRPLNGARFDEFDGRGGRNFSLMVMVGGLVTAPLAVAGAVVASRRKVALWPLVSFVVAVAFTAATTWGAVRFRIGAEPALLVLAAFAVAWVLPGDAGWRARAGAGDRTAATATDDGA